MVDAWSVTAFANTNSADTFVFHGDDTRWRAVYRMLSTKKKVWYYYIPPKVNNMIFRSVFPIAIHLKFNTKQCNVRKDKQHCTTTSVHNAHMLLNDILCTRVEEEKRPSKMSMFISCMAVSSSKTKEYITYRAKDV